MCSTIGDAASIATLIMFIIYFAGRIIVIRTSESVVEDKIELIDSKNNKVEYNIIETISLGTNPENTILITARNVIHRFTAFQIVFDKDKNEVGKTEEYLIKHINVNQTVEVNVTMAETINEYELSYLTSDFRKVTIPLYSNLKNGVVSEIAQPKHTWKSILYYLFR